MSSGTLNGSAPARCNSPRAGTNWSSYMDKDTRPKSRLERLQAKGKIPQGIKDWGKHDSVTVFNTRNNWVNSHLGLLIDLHNQQIECEIKNRKELARKSGNIRKARILENGYSYYSLIQVLTTYGKNCHICSTPIDLKASRRVGISDWFLGLHIDHLIAIANGGSDTLENVRPSHAICNLKKGIK